MGKIFGLLACIGTAAMVSGCVKANQPKNYDRSTLDTQIEEIKASADEDIKKLLEGAKRFQVCRTKETDQTIGADVEAAAVAADIQTTSQDTIYVNCDGKENSPGKIVDPAFGSVVISGMALTEPLIAVEIESARTCGSVEISEKVLDVAQVTEKKNSFEADGDILLITSNLSVKIATAMNVVAGKNLLKVKYIGCETWQEVTSPEGTVSNVCAIKKTLDQKEVLLNVTVSETVVEGTRKVDLCEKPKAEKPAEQPKTDDQV